jgi:hypothetical protein
MATIPTSSTKRNELTGEIINKLMLPLHPVMLFNDNKATGKTYWQTLF